MKSSFALIGLLLIVSLVVGCGGPAALKKPEPDSDKPSEEISGNINEKFDPMLLDEDDIDIKKTISPESKSENADAILFPSTSEKRPEELDGYRVQLCAVSDEDKAKDIQRQAIMQFIDYNVYLRYDSPYYKVRVGDCVNRFEAEQLQQQAVASGFVDAWVVRSKIKLPPEEKPIPQYLENEPPN
ncbi:MAG TPA: SPOR domain-containing protein [bacterium]|nr:SPOR domain-containing protein [bacterium]HDQ00130.1 SPOR domain-containing protein [bacterium]